MRLRTTPRLAKLANGNCACPVYYDFRFSRWLNFTYLPLPEEVKFAGLVHFSPSNSFATVARDKPYYLKRAIRPPKKRDGYHIWHKSKHIPEKRFQEWADN